MGLFLAWLTNWLSGTGTLFAYKTTGLGTVGSKLTHKVGGGQSLNLEKKKPSLYCKMMINN